MPTNSLTDARCKGAKPADKPYKLFDGGGLYLYVTPAGGKIWRLAYRIGKVPQTKSLGPYPAVTLVDARAKRDEEKAKVRAGIDPMQERRAARRDARLFEVACREYWGIRNDLSESYRQNAMRGLEMHLFPSLGQKDVNAIDRAELLKPLLAMDAAGKHVYVRKVRMWAGQVFDREVELGNMAINPAALIKTEKVFGKAAVIHFAALELREIPEFMQRLAMERELQSVLANRMLAYTWVRTNELRMMLWAEIDWDSGMWLIPAAKMKRPNDHLVPLSRQAMALLKVMEARSWGSKYVFPSDRRLDRPMSENAILYLIGRIGYKGRMTGHGWRSVGSTWANERGFNPDAIERQLAHVPEDEVRGVYNRAKYIQLRREMLQAWADWLDSCEHDAGSPQR